MNRTQDEFVAARKPAWDELDTLLANKHLLAQAATHVDFACCGSVPGDLLRSHARAHGRLHVGRHRLARLVGRAHELRHVQRATLSPGRIVEAHRDWLPVERAAQRPLHGSGRRAFHLARSARLRRRPSFARVRHPDHVRIHGGANGEVLQRPRSWSRRRRGQHDGQFLRLQQRRHRLSAASPPESCSAWAACSFSSSTGSASAWWPGP